jgi:hypothetical protein
MCVRKNEPRGFRDRAVRGLRNEEPSAGGGPRGTQVREVCRMVTVDR